MDFCDRYSQHFVQQGMNSVVHARHYLSGLLGTQRRKNMETIENDVAESDYQGMEQFISSSPWDHHALMDQVAQDANAFLGHAQEAGLFIDETSFLKKGKASVGVQRQWSGRAGKLENCQVGVFTCLGRNQRIAITDFRLFLPESWAEDETRCAKAKIPDEHRRYQPKWQHALEMVRHAKEQGLQFGWVGVDSLYGSNATFINEVEDMGLGFMADVSKVTKVWSSEPKLETPPPEQSGRGRPRSRVRLHADNQAEYLSVEELTAKHFETHHRKLCYRQGHKGQLWGRFWVCEVWCWEKLWPQPRKRLLVVRHNQDEGFKYSLTNLAENRDWEYYAWVQAQRFWIEHAFHEAKSQLGMAQYQVRVWKGWHHHMSLVCLALLFSVKVQDQVAEKLPILSVRDITELLDYYLPRRGNAEEEVMARIRKRHDDRLRDLERRKDKQVGIPISFN